MNCSPSLSVKPLCDFPSAHLMEICVHNDFKRMSENVFKLQRFHHFANASHWRNKPPCMRWSHVGDSFLTKIATECLPTVLASLTGHLIG